MKSIIRSSFAIFFLVIIIFNNSHSMDMNIGDSISSFSANDDNGNLWNLQDNLNQKYLVVYFYPVALTGG